MPDELRCKIGAVKDRIVAIVPAAGIGKRFGHAKNKLLYELAGKPLIIWALELLQSVAEIDEIVPVLKGDDLKAGIALIESYSMPKVKRIVPGGKERQDSVYNGIKILDDSTSIVVIHDGARPFADKDLIRTAIEELKGYDGVVTGVPVKDTIKECKVRSAPGGAASAHEHASELLVKKTLDRSVLWAVQTPQVFKFQKLKAAHKKARSEGYYATDDAALIEKYGGSIKIIGGSYGNIKITTPEDIAIAEAILKASTKH
ncbi:MAG: 2-C-methyl-D-erythritol 4-phosphate cytidylyltransferase [Nitrospirae bacterium]|nr:2-C-methyl-D-erythritol 4-phosphate cytidylyltransferase [Nitrospirota bacterium]MCL5236753.1 2-C-methyl-D-erythritol 4-phosphate cytidylyltransferase [Nitrospirota bacterium]